MSEAYGDPLTRPFWEAAARRELLVQRCEGCGHHQLYPRPFCLRCGADAVEWIETAGRGTVYSVTTVRIPVIPELTPPYQVAIVELAEGPRLLTAIEGGPAAIGDRVSIIWRERTDAPPLPCFAVK